MRKLKGTGPPWTVHGKLPPDAFSSTYWSTQLLSDPFILAILYQKIHSNTVSLKPGMSNFSPRENRFYEISLREHGREILPSKSPNGREKRHSPFKISLGEFEGRISFQNLPSEERKYFLGRIWNLPWKFNIEINVFWPLEVRMAHIIWDIYQIIDIWWAIIGTVRTIIRVQNINSDLKNSKFLIFLGNRF